MQRSSSALSPVIALPAFAPLPVSMILHMLEETHDTFVAQVQQASTSLKHRLTTLEERVEVVREHVYEAMVQKLAETPRLQMKWLQDSIAQRVESKQVKRREEGKIAREYTISVRTMNNWRSNNVLLPHEPRKLNLDRAAAMLIVAIIDERKQGFFPSYIDPAEPEYWGYIQTAPDAPVLPCPFPPPDLPVGTLYWSRWPSFDPRFKQFPGRGSLGFVSLDEASLKRWDPTFTNLDMRLIFDNTSFFGRKMSQERLHDLAEALYYRLAPSRLLTTPDLALVFPAWPPSTSD